MCVLRLYGTCVWQVHAEYFRRVHAMFERHKRACGFAHVTLEFMDGAGKKPGPGRAGSVLGGT